MGGSMTSVILYLCFLGITEITSEQLLNRYKRGSVPVVPEPETINTTMNNTHIVDTSHNDNTGLIVGVVVAGIIAIVIVVLLVIFILKKRQRSSDIEREAKVQMNTTKNAGVYVDLATNPEEDKGDTETDKLRNAEDA